VKRKFDNDFKVEAVKLVLENKRSVAAVAREIGIGVDPVWWVQRGLIFMLILLISLV